jgi:hypothetical protein
MIKKFQEKRRLKEKHKIPLTFDEELFHLIMKVFIPLVIFLTIAVGIDIYRYLH